METLAIPVVKQDRTPAALVVTTRESTKSRATVNVRLALPRRTMLVTLPDAPDVVLPRFDGEGGHPVSQFGLVMN